MRVSDLDLMRRRLSVSRSATEVRGAIEMGTPKNGKGRVVGLPAFLTDRLSIYVPTIARDALSCTQTSAVGRCAARTGGVEYSTPRRAESASLPRRCASTICGTQARRSRSLPAPT